MPQIDQVSPPERAAKAPESRAGGIRERNRVAIEAEILEIAGRHLAEQGAAGISLRAIAREMGMASSAIYRYVANRDDLLTRLIVAAYGDSADTVQAAVDELPGDHDAVTRFRTAARALRGWALSSPHEYALLYGSPVPGYDAPGDQTIEAGTRIPRLLLAVHEPDLPDPTGDEAMVFGHMSGDPALAPTAPSAAQLRRGLAAWTLLLGAISAELFEYFGAGAITDPEAHFELVLDDAELLYRRP
ncbi:MAG: TetR/AcrR family transcriptional regulator [Microthrixaceae bacterium]